MRDAGNLGLGLDAANPPRREAHTLRLPAALAPGSVQACATVELFGLRFHTGNAAATVAAVAARRRVPAANWSACWYLLSAFAVINYTENAVYVAFAALGSWLGAYASVTWLVRPAPPPA